MTASTILADLPGNAPSQRLQVALIQRHDGRLAVELREQHHGEGIGWFDQRVLALDPKQLRQLQAVLRLKDLELSDEEQDAPPATIPFPGPRSIEPGRATGSDA